ncbi:hypothetical protein CLOHAE12215_01831 [Clostridium haemolyticum]|uniref:hypothetical protein n=1 Tax=Clostridium haemolyticum TaxID=84025 RepID=UPI001C3A8C77|nr:hypothetical protein [Clostridium haemolyticum]CAG7840407.1 hypothetical protein CLOHAE12215_01831 [Clostridium haemolyticum]
MYKELVTATIFIPSFKDGIFNFSKRKFSVKSSLKEEINYILQKIKDYYPKNQEILNSNNTREQLEKRYKNADKIR